MLVGVLLLWLSAKKFQVVDVNLGDGALGVIPCGVLPCPQLSFYVEFCTFADIILNDTNDVAVGYYAVPLGALRHLCAVTLGVTLVGCCESECGELPTVALSDFGVAANISQ